MQVKSQYWAVQANQWLVAKSGGLEVIASAMRGWREYPMVQLCALLCMVPLALDNTVLQVRTPAAPQPQSGAHPKSQASDQSLQ